jgi:hypothetical protein
LASSAPEPWWRLRGLTRLGWPARFPVVQFPNAPLILALVAGAAARTTHGAAHDALAAISSLALALWAYGELRYGVNWFRRLLGLTFAILLVLKLARGALS